MNKLYQPQVLALIQTLDQQARFGIDTGKRLMDLAELIGSDGAIPLRDALQRLFPGPDENNKQALEAFRKWRADLKKDLQKRGSDLLVAVDSKKKSTIEERFCWFEGTPIESNKFAEFTEVAAADKPLNQQVQPRGKTFIESDESSAGNTSLTLGYCFVFAASISVEARAFITALMPWLGADFDRVGGPIEVAGPLAPGDKHSLERAGVCLLLLGPESLDEVADLLKHRKSSALAIQICRGKQADWHGRFVYALNGKAYCELNKPKKGEFLEAVHAQLKERAPALSDKPEHLLCEPTFDGQNIDVVEHVQRTKGKRFDLNHGDTSHQVREGQDLVQALLDWSCAQDSPVFAALLGEYGMGKTTTCRMFSQALLDRKTIVGNTPAVVYLDLREAQQIVGRELSCEALIEHVLKQSWRELESAPPTAKEVVRAVQKERAVLIYDGLDEVLNLLDERQGAAFCRELWRVLPAQNTQGGYDASVGKILVSCRTHFFKSLDHARGQLLDHQRGAQKADSYRAWLVMPFDAQQVRSYLAAALPQRDPDELVELFSQVHNLNDLATRPYTLELITAQVESLERAWANNEVINTATLYDGFIQQWLERDTGKHHIKPEHKKQLMQYLAYEMWRGASRSWDAETLDDALLDFFENNKRIERHYKNVELDLLKEDLRNATFVVWGEKSGFRFAHTSMQEFFLADYLVAALAHEAPAAEVWAIRQPSIETFALIADRLDGLLPCRAVLQTLIDNYTPSATRNAFSYAVRSLGNDRWAPSLQSLRLQGETLRDIQLQGRPDTLIDLKNAQLVDCEFYRVELQHADIHNAVFDGSRFFQSTVLHCDDEKVDWGKTEFYVDAYGNRGGILTSRLAEHPAEIMPKIGRRTAIRGGHKGPVQSCGFSADGTRIVSGGSDGSVRVWDAQSGQEQQVLRGHKGWVQSCGFSADGTRIVSGGDDGSVRVWDAQSGDEQQVLRGHEGVVQSCGFSADGTRLVSGGDDGSVRVWDAQSGDEQQVLRGHEGVVRSCGFSADGTRLVSGGDDGSVRVWDAQSGDEQQVLRGHEGVVWSCGFSADGTRIVSGGSEGSVRVWDAQSGDEQQVLRGHEGVVWSCGFSADGTRIVSGGSEGSVRVWDAQSGDEQQVLRGHEGVVWSCGFSADGTRLVSGGDDGSVRVWDAQSGDEQQVLRGHVDWVLSCGLSADGTRLVSGGMDGSVRVWDAQSGDEQQVLRGHEGVVWSCGISADGTRLVSGGMDGSVRVWDAQSGDEQQVLRGHVDWVLSCGLSADGTRLVSGGMDGSVRVWDAQSGDEQQVLRGHEGEVQSCGFSADGTRIVSGGSEGSVRVWDAQSGDEQQVLRGHEGVVWSCGFSADGTRLVSGGDDGSVRVWDAQSGDEQQVLRGHEGVVWSCGFSADGTRLVSGGMDGSVRVWDAQIGQEQQVLRGHEGEVQSCGFSADGTRIVSGGRDGSVRVWHAKSGTLLKIYFGLPQSAACLDGEGNLLSGYGPLWRYFSCRAPDTKGEMRAWPLEMALNEEQRSWLSYE